MGNKTSPQQREECKQLREKVVQQVTGEIKESTQKSERRSDQRMELPGKASSEQTVAIPTQQNTITLEGLSCKELDMNSYFSEVKSNQMMR
jgi:hypothetical protein